MWFHWTHEGGGFTPPPTLSLNVFFCNDLLRIRTLYSFIFNNDLHNFHNLHFYIYITETETEKKVSFEFRVFYKNTLLMVFLI